jgi:hypothetical protein
MNDTIQHSYYCLCHAEPDSTIIRNALFLVLSNLPIFTYAMQYHDFE